jgi:DNA-binding transcriptional MerR regulator
MLACHLYLVGMRDEDRSVTLEELARLTGLEPRTLRSWIAAGLLAPPSKGGRGARYPADNVTRALAVRALRERHGLGLEEAGRWLLHAPAEALAELARTAEPLVAPPRGRATAYLRAVREAGRPLAATADAMQVADALEAGLDFADPAQRLATAIGGPGRSGLAALLALLERHASAAPRRGARARHSTSVPIVPGLELTSTGPLDDAEQAMLERIAALMRSILTGGCDDDDQA